MKRRNKIFFVIILCGLRIALSPSYLLRAQSSTITKARPAQTKVTQKGPTPTLDETDNWIMRNLNSVQVPATIGEINSWLDDKNATFDVQTGCSGIIPARTRQRIELDACNATFSHLDLLPPSQVVTSIVSFSMADLDPDSILVRAPQSIVSGAGCTKGSSLYLETTNRALAIKQKFALLRLKREGASSQPEIDEHWNPDPSPSDHPSMFGIMLFFPDEPSATKMSNAFHDAISACHGKKSVKTDLY